MTILTRNHALLTAEVKAHIEADALVRGTYWEGGDTAQTGKGCFIGCLTHSDEPLIAMERFGLPEPLLRIAEDIFEDLSEEESKAFFAALPGAVGCDGKDLSRVHWHFLAADLRALPPQIGNVKAAIERVIVGMDLLASGQEWQDTRAAADAAASAAASAADAAAYAAADAAAYAAAYAAYAAHAARIRQRDTFLQLIADAPVMETHQ